MAEGERLDAGHVYKPRYRPEGAGQYVPPAGHCCAAVHDAFSVGFHQCSKRPKFKRDVLWYGKPVTLEYCGVHGPVAVKARRDARDAKWRAESEARRAAQAEADRLRDLRAAAVDALKSIAKGHNDPRSLAIGILTACKEPF